MPITLSHIRRYRFDSDMVHKLDKLKSFGINESAFVRLAIDEKLTKELPKIKKREYNYCPF